jgi:hypothetical protein
MAGRSSPRSAPARVERTVKSAAPTTTQRNTGWATLTRSGETRLASQKAMTLIATANRPSVESSIRPVKATMTGLANRLTRASATANQTKPRSPAP